MKRVYNLILGIVIVSFICLIFANIAYIHKLSLSKTTAKASADQTTLQLTVEPQILKVLVKQGESFKTGIKVRNPEKVNQNFEISLSPSLKDAVFFSNYSFSLKSGEDKIIYLTFISTNETKPDVYPGTLKIETSSNSKEIPIIFTVKSKIILFDVSLDIPVEYREVFPGNELLLQLTLFNLGDLGKTEVHVEYIVKDFAGNTAFGQEIIKDSTRNTTFNTAFGQENTVNVETQASFSKMIKLPSNIELGEYVAIAQVRYDYSVGSSSEIFHVLTKETPYNIIMNNKHTLIIINLIIIAGMIVIIFIIVLLERWRRKMKKIVSMQEKEIGNIYRRIERKKVMPKEASEIIKKVSRQKEALEKAYAKGYISRDSYLKGKGRIENLLRIMKNKYL